MVKVKLPVWLIEGVWRKWSIAPRHDPFVTCRRVIAMNWVRSWGGFQGRYGYCACRHPSGVTAPSERSRLGVVFHSLFIGGAIVHIYNGDESGVLRNWVALPRSSVLQPNLTVVTATYKRRITRLACCKTRVVSFCFLNRCVAMFCFHFASTDLPARC